MPGRERFPRSERIKRRAEYEDVYRKGDKSVNRSFICFVVRHDEPGRKFGLAVSRKVGGAVVRNRVKRYIRQAYRKSRMQLVDTISVVIIARPSAATLTCQECNDAIGHLFRKGGLLRD